MPRWSIKRLGGYNMRIDVTDAARSELKKLMEEKNTDKPIRIGVASGGSSFDVFLDDAKDGDEIVKYDDFQFVIEDGLSQAVNMFKIDYSDSFCVTPFTWPNWI
ncbi:hypothetical protein E9840_01645 [Tissierella creatinini]|nr:hypothetical protein E9840_01645 [Tissierella creatinini]TJX61853.1 hypothetical protein E8P77_18140 [Soehngenia saccharolytica]